MANKILLYGFDDLSGKGIHVKTFDSLSDDQELKFVWLLYMYLQT